MVFLKHTELAKLVMKSRQGDSQAFQKLYEHTSSIQYYHLLQMTQNSEDAQDALQEVYVLLYKNLDKIKSPDSIVAYLNRLSYFVGKNVKRNNENYRKRIVDIENASDLSDSQFNVDQNIARQENSDVINNALKQLTDQEQTVLISRYFQKLTLKQTAYAMGISLATVKRLQNTAKKHMKEILADHRHIMWALVVPKLTKAVENSASELNVPSFTSSGTQYKAPEDLFSTPPKAHPGLAAAGSIGVKSLIAAAGAAGLCYAGSLVVPGPSLRYMKLPNTYTAAPAPAAFAITSPVPVKSAVLTGAKGNSIPLFADSEGIFHGNLPANGKYRLTVSSVAGKTLVKDFQFQYIDTVSPELVSYSEEDGNFILKFRDEETGVNYDTMYCKSKDGIITLPSSKNAQKNTAVFQLPYEDQILFFEDMAGNNCTVSLEHHAD